MTGEKKSQKSTGIGLLWETFLWWLGNLIYGLLPLWVVLFICELPTSQPADVAFNGEKKHLLHDGALNFFCLTIMGSIGVDFLQSKKRFSSSFKNIMVATAVIPLVVVIIIYITMTFAHDGFNSF